MFNTEILKYSHFAINKAAEYILNGEIIGLPTETVYGLAGRIDNIDSINKIFHIKGRPQDNPLIVHVSDIDMANKLIKKPMNGILEKLANKFWPGPLTIIMDKSNLINDVISCNLSTVAIRIPDSRSMINIIKKINIPLAAPSANISGKPSCTSAFHVFDDMNTKIPLILDDGNCEFGIESTIINLSEDNRICILRPGGITLEDLYSVTKNVYLSDFVLNKRLISKCISPGVKYKHYSPSGDVYLINGSNYSFTEFLMKNIDTSYKNCAIIFKNDFLNIENIDIFYNGDLNDYKFQSKNIFSILREIDKKSYDKIYIRAPKKIGIGLAVYNRIIRAADFKVVDLD
ncbi:MAG: threonylcarbamoyl-AMP synthase [Oscillospiraceae bacterium]|nr:threonylcarbamoyl-AMP synthase [Oscillospiraceae bacterium]